MMNIITNCEYQVNPIGIQTQTPRLSWRIEDHASLAPQSKYRIIVSDSNEHIADGTGSLWDSGIIQSNRSLCIEYKGRELKSKTKYFWKVFIWCDGIESPLESDISTFETAIFTDEEWNASWIRHPYPEYGTTTLFRKEFITYEAAQEARAYICGLGYYILYINGERVEDRVLEPGWTDYRKTVLYSVYDISKYIIKGKNSICVELGEGWYGHKHSSLKINAGGQPSWNDKPELIFEIDTIFVNGSKIQIVSNEDCNCTYGNIIQNSIYDGETAVGPQEIIGWKGIEYKFNSSWVKAVYAKAPEGKMLSQIMPPIRVTESIQPASIKMLNENRYVIDMGQNFSGWVNIEMNGDPYTTMKIYYSETLNEYGLVNQDNLRHARNMDTYILKGNGVERYQPSYTYRGFRYVEIILERPVNIINVTGKVVHSDLKRISSFECSNELLNRIYKAVIWTERSNLHSVPTDCPQRDERQAWLNDVTVRCEELLYNFDAVLFLEKWLNDITDAQTEMGSIPDTAPFIYGGNPSFHISSCFILIPWFIYKNTGDDTVMRRFYPKMKKYVEFLEQQTSTGLIGEPFMGDWAPPIGEGLPGAGWGAIPKNIEKQMINTSYLVYDCKVMKEIANKLGHFEDIVHYDSLKEKLTKTINNVFYNNESGCYSPDSQGNNVMPLFLGFAAEKDRVLGALLNNIEQADYHITTGNQTTKYIFELLDMENYNETAYKIASSLTYPSLGYMLENGATTIWERWEYLTGAGMNSHNHPMLAAYTAWYFKALAGIRLDKSGDNLSTVLISPAFIKELNFIKSDVITQKGKISIEIKNDSGIVNLYVKLPWNIKPEFVFANHTMLENVHKNNEYFIKLQPKEGV